MLGVPGRSGLVRKDTDAARKIRSTAIADADIDRAIGQATQYLRKFRAPCSLVPTPSVSALVPALRILGLAQVAWRGRRSGVWRPHLLEVELADEAVSWLTNCEDDTVDDRLRGEVAICLPRPVLNEVRWK
jgi:hypothetical protein